MERGDAGCAALWCKAPRGSQELLLAADPAHFFAPPYVGVNGWIGMRLDAAADWDEVTALVRRSLFAHRAEAARSAGGLNAARRYAGASDVVRYSARTGSARSMLASWTVSPSPDTRGCSGQLPASSRRNSSTSMRVLCTTRISRRLGSVA